MRDGLTYVTKKEQHIVYLGRRMWYEQSDSYRSNNKDKGRVGSKEHVFCDLQGKNFQIVRSVPNTIAAVADEHCHPQFSQWVDDYHKTEMSAEVIDWVKEPIPIEQFTSRDWRNHPTSSMTTFIEAPDGTFREVTIRLSHNRSDMFYGWPRRTLPPVSGDIDNLVYTIRRRIGRDGSEHYDQQYYVSGHNETRITDKSIFFDLYVKFANGITRKWR